MSDLQVALTPVIINLYKAIQDSGGQVFKNNILECKFTMYIPGQTTVCLSAEYWDATDFATVKEIDE